MPSLPFTHKHLPHLPRLSPKNIPSLTIPTSILISRSASLPIPTETTTTPSFCLSSTALNKHPSPRSPAHPDPAGDPKPTIPIPTFTVSFHDPTLLLPSRHPTHPPATIAHNHSLHPEPTALNPTSLPIPFIFILVQEPDISLLNREQQKGKQVGFRGMSRFLTIIIRRYERNNTRHNVNSVISF